MKIFSTPVFGAMAMLTSILVTGFQLSDATALPTTVTEVPIGVETTKRIQSFSSLGFTRSEEMKAMEIMQDIAEKFNMEAIPFLLIGMKDQNERIRYYSLSTISIIIGEFRRDKKLSDDVDMTTYPFPATQKKMIKEIFDYSLNATEDTFPEIRKSAFYTLDILRSEKALPAFKVGIRDRDAGVRFFACIALKHMGFQEYNILEVVSGKLLQNPEDYVPFLGVREHGMDILAERELKSFGRKAIPALITGAKSNNSLTKQRSINLLGELKAEEAIPVFERYLNEDTKDETTRMVQIFSVYALKNISTLKATEAALKYGLSSKDTQIQIKTSDLFFDAAPKEIMPVLTQLSQSSDSQIKAKVSILLADHKNKEAIPLFIELLPERQYFILAKNYLENITGQNFGNIPPVTTKKMVEDYINKWKDWWEKNKETFKFPEK